MDFLTWTINRSIFFFGKVMGNFFRKLSGNFNFSSVYLAQIRWKSDFFMCLTHCKDFIEAIHEGLTSEIGQFTSVVLHSTFLLLCLWHCGPLSCHGLPIAKVLRQLIIYEVTMFAWPPTRRPYVFVWHLAQNLSVEDDSPRHDLQCHILLLRLTKTVRVFGAELTFWRLNYYFFNFSTPCI